MIDKIQNIFKFKRRNAKTFFLFLGFSSLIWVLVQFSKTYTKVVQIPIVYENEPLDKIILDENPKSLKVKMTDNGFGIMYYRLFTPSMHINLEETEERDGQLVFLIENHREEIEEQIGINYNKSEILEDRIAINFYQKLVKKVPVIPNVSINYKVGYGSSDTLQLSPDSITVSGYEKIVDTLSAVYTDPLEIENVSSDIEGEISIKKDGLKDVSLYQQQVKYFLKVEKFTEGRVSIPIEVINVPAGVDISIFPQEVIVVYQVNLDNYNKINKNDFRVVCDFKGIDENEKFLIPSIEAKPEAVKNLRLSEKKVEYVIKK